jgi:type I restriction-modification system DNA methylase subunit
MTTPIQHHDWLSLIEISGPFLAVPVLKEAFPQGLEELDATKRKRLRQAYEEWREALELEDAQFAELHGAWIDEVLSRGLELDEDGKGDVLKRADWCVANLQAILPENGVTLSPDLAVVGEQRANRPLMLIQTYAQDVDLDATQKIGGWAATPADRMVQLCRSLGCRLGLVTNGERWMLVDAPVGAVTTFASWYARIWSQEPITLQAFVHLLGIRRFFVDESEQLPALFDRSLKFQDEVTDALGEQVRRAVEVLIQTLDKADQDRNRELLHDVKEPELYEAALTVMMRLVFLLSAEERGLLLMGDERYEAYYALSTLRMQLRKESEEILERRWDAWSRLLAIFRAVFGGIEHENLRLPALGGSLFDPDRFPFLEGRAKGSSWHSDAAKPLPIDNRTVLLLLEAIQQFQGRTLSYRALDVEQIGYVYEGLLERTVKRTDDVTLELDATKSAKAPWIKLAELDSARLDGAARLAELLQERSGSSASRVRNDLAKPVDDTLADRLLTACLGDTKLRDRVKPYAHLLRTDPWGYPLVYPAGAFIVITGSDRRETGTHYTPKSLTEAIVTETLTPVAYVGPAEGTPRDQWVLKSPAELLDLKICDPAMGSGAFLVQACRWLSDRLVEAWSQVEASGQTVTVDGEVLDLGAAKELLPRDSEARTVIARRLIAERCLYGVDLNPLAVELAKLSIWLVTLAKERPFGFLDHNLRCGDSLLGIHRLEQLTELCMTPDGKGQQQLFGQNIKRSVHEALELRQQLRTIPIRDIHDVETMARLDTDARRALEVSELIADAFIGEVLASAGNGNALDNATTFLAIQAGRVVDGDQDAALAVVRRALTSLSTNSPVDKSGRKPFHWPLEFPEVFSRGFDAVIGNPPFVKATSIGEVLGSAYRVYLGATVGRGKKASYADLCSFFLLRTHSLISPTGGVGLVATNTISQGDTREMGLDQLFSDGFRPYWVMTDVTWSGTANVVVSLLATRREDQWIGQRGLNDKKVDHITQFLTEGSGEIFQPNRLSRNKGLAFKGSTTGCKGFVLSDSEAKILISLDKRYEDVVQPFIGGQDFNSSPKMTTERWVINFRDWSYEKAAHYPACLDILEKRVKPYFEARTGQIHEKDYWKFSDKRLESYESIVNFERVLFHAFTSKHLAFGFVCADIVYSAPHVVVALQGYEHFAILQSSLHLLWVVEICSTMGTGIRYAPSDLLETFPFPFEKITEIPGGDLSIAGKEYYEERSKFMEQNEIGLTDFYNLFHDPGEQDPGIVRIRGIHAAIDRQLCEQYSIDEPIDHQFVETKIGVRYLPSGNGKSRILARLKELNGQYFQEEYSQGLHGGFSKAKTPVGSSRKASAAQHGFDFGNVSYGSETTKSSHVAATAVIEYLGSHSGWHAKADVLAATGITDSNWNAAISELIDRGKVERQGERRGARYRATDAGGTAQ